MTQTNASPKAVDKASSKVGRGRPRKDPSAVKRQCSFSLTDESISQLKEMALAQGISASEFLGQLIGKAYASKQHLKGLAALTQDERDALNKKRAVQLRNTKARQQHADELNFKRRHGELGGLTNVMVIAAPKAVTGGAKGHQDGLRIPGIFCANLGDVWLVPYGLLKGIDAVELISYPCYASVFDYFAGHRIPVAQLSSFIAAHSSFKLSSAAEKSTLAKLAQQYEVNLPQVDESYQLRTKARQEDHFKGPLDEFFEPDD